MHSNDLFCFFFFSFSFRIRSLTGVRNTTTSQKPSDKLRWFSNIQQEVEKSATCRRLRHLIHRTTYLVLTAAENSARVWQIDTYPNAKTLYPTKRTQQRRKTEFLVGVCWCKLVPLPICRLLIRRQVFLSSDEMIHAVGLIYSFLNSY